MPALDGLLIDCDGVLCDSEPLSARAWAVTLRRHGFEPTPDDLAGMVGLTERDVATRFAEQAGGAPTELESEARTAFLEVVNDGVPVFPDALTLLDRAERRGVPVCVVSNSFRWRLDAVLGAAGIDGRLTVAGDEVARPKPAPDAYLAGARMLGADPRRCLVVEDSPTGVRAGIEAGCRVVAVDRGLFPLDRLVGAETVVRSVAGVIDQAEER